TGLALRLRHSASRRVAEVEHAAPTRTERRAVGLHSNFVAIARDEWYVLQESRAHPQRHSLLTPNGPALARPAGALPSLFDRELPVPTLDERGSMRSPPRATSA